MARHAGTRRGGLDPGWLFIIAGLAVCASALLIPAQRDLEDVREKLVVLKAYEGVSRQRMVTYDHFLVQVEREDPALLKRLAASQFNLLPEGETPILHDLQASGVSFDQWIESSLESGGLEQNPTPDTTLAQVANGPYRVLFMAGGILCLFIGLVPGRQNNRAAGETAD